MYYSTPDWCMLALAYDNYLYWRHVLAHGLGAVMTHGELMRTTQEIIHTRYVLYHTSTSNTCKDGEQ